MNESAIITLDHIIDRCLAKYFGKNDAVQTLVSDGSYQEAWQAFIKWIKYNLDTGKAISIQNLGSISLQIYNEDSIIYFNLYDTFLMETGLNYDRLLSHEVKYPTLVTNFVNIKKFTHLDQIQLTTAIENIINEIREIFRSFTNFEMDLGILGKFF